MSGGVSRRSAALWIIDSERHLPAPGPLVQHWLRVARLALVAAFLLMIVPAAVYAQATITGAVKDTSGALLPGVSVDVESPALIERVRTDVTDGAGRYRIEALPPGTYTVTFTLPGFATFRREGVELTGTFVAAINADLPVATVAETVTVTGEAPMVDVQSATKQTVLNQEVLDALPVARTPLTLLTIIPGVTQSRLDVGGLDGDGSSRSRMTIRGVAENIPMIRNISMKTTGTPSSDGAITNMMAYQEMVVDVAGNGVEKSFSGAHINLVPRDGGNAFNGRFFGNFANGAMQGNNFTQELQNRGLSVPNTIKKMWDLNPGFGGPIQRDRLWFYWTARYSGAYQWVPMFFNKNAGDVTKWTYEADPSQQVADQNSTRNYSTLRFAWQASPKNKIGLLYEKSRILDWPRLSGPTVSPEANMSNYNSQPKSHWEGDWTAPVTSRFLLEATVVKFPVDFRRPDHNILFPAGSVPLIQVQEQSSGLNYRGTANVTGGNSDNLSSNLIASYVSGRHTAKVGFDTASNSFGTPVYSPDAPLVFRFNNGVPNQITQYATPYDSNVSGRAYGLFAQDRLTIEGITLHGGLRFEALNTWAPESRIGPSAFTPNRNIVFPKTDGVAWKDITGTTGFAMDLFGDGKTALKASLGRYVADLNLRSNFVTGVTPITTLVTNTTRSWNDANRNFVPDCDLTSRAANGECGAMAAANFGSTVPAQSVDPDLTTGWGKRPNNHWEFTVDLQREILPRVTVSVDYWRTWSGKFVVVDNRAVSPSDYDAFSITAPSDPRLPGGGGYLISGLYDLKPSSFGRPTDNIVLAANKFGKQIEHWNGVDITMNARLRGGMFVQGSVSSQRQTTDNCDVVTKIDNPSPLYCHVQGEFLPQVKFMGSYTIPRIALQVSSNFQSLAGPEILANYTATNAVILPSLGRNLSGGSNVTVNLVEPHTMYGDRTTMLDLRFARALRVDRTRATVQVDLYNALNANPVFTLNNSFAVWQQPQSVLPARFAKVGVTLEF